MPAPLLPSRTAPSARRAVPPDPVGSLLGGAAALGALALAGLVAVVFAAAVALAVLLALVLAALGLAAARAWGGRRRRPAVISARWTGYGWDAA